MEVRGVWGNLVICNISGRFGISWIFLGTGVKRLFYLAVYACMGMVQQRKHSMEFGPSHRGYHDGTQHQIDMKQ